MNESAESPDAPEVIPPAPPPPPTAAGATDYPVTLNIQRQDEYSRFLPLVKWLLLIPHYIVLLILWVGALFAILFSFFAVLFTRRYPRGLFDYVLGVGRWSQRVTAYFLLMVDPYPPFSLDDDPDYPVHFDITYPDEVDRWRPLVHWLLIIPYALIASVLMYLAYLASFFALFTIAFTKRFPEGLFKLVLVPLRWQARYYAYEGWMVTRYPPFVWDAD